MQITSVNGGVAECKLAWVVNSYSPPIDGFDENYLVRLRNGDEETASHFQKYFRRMLRRWMWGRFTHDEEEELIDDAMATAFDRIKLGQPKDATKLAAYVTGICLNLSRLALRTGFERKAEPIEGLNLSDPRPSPEAQLLSAEQAKQVRMVLESLGTRDRAILIDLFFHDQEREEVCERYGVDRAALRLILFRARKRFQDGWPRGN